MGPLIKRDRSVSDLDFGVREVGDESALI